MSNRVITREQILVHTLIKVVMSITREQDEKEKEEILARSAAMAGADSKESIGKSAIKLCQELLSMYEQDHMRYGGNKEKP